jgi:ABC-type branched-subunit amino acid transport system substrate-binding protein
MNSLMLVPRRQAAQWTPAHVARALADGTPARRVFVIGLMQVDRKLLLPGLLIETIGHSASAFEQYQALKLMAEHLQQLDARQRAELARVLASELADDGSGRGQIGVDSSRRALAEQMLAQLLAAAGKP